MTKKSYRALALSVALTASVTALPAQYVYAAEEGEPAAEGVFNPLNLPDISAAPSEVIPSDQATAEQTTAPGVARPELTPEEIAAARAKAEAEEAAAQAKAAENAAAQADANAADKQLKETGTLPTEMPAEVPAEASAENADVSAEAAPEEAPKEAAPETAPEAAKPAVADNANQTAADRWAKSRPDEDRIDRWLSSFEGQTIVDVEFQGASPETLKDAKAALSTRSGDVFKKDRMENDRAAIYDTGWFYDVFPTFQTIPEGVVITYHVLENPTLVSFELTGNKAESTEKLMKLVTVKEGRMLNTRELHENIQAITNKYHDDGYILVKLSNLDIDRDGKLKIVINEGILEGYTVKGNTKTKDKVVIREMRQKPGEAFNAKLARRGMQRVYNLGFFEDVNMKLNPGVEPNAVVLEVDVVEKRTGNFSVGAGYSSRDGFVGMVGVGDTNFRGIGDAFNFQFEFSGDNTDAHGYSFMYRKPWLDRRETAVTFRIYNRTYEYYDYNTDGDKLEEYMRKYSGGEITLSRPMNEYQTNYITLKNRKDRYISHEGGPWNRSGDALAPDAKGNIVNSKEWRDKNFGLTRSITLTHVTDTRDNVYFPMTGDRLSFSGEFGGFGGDFNFRKFTVEENHYIKAGHAQVFALRGMYGRGFGNITEANEYRIGGQTTLRGYRDDQFRGNNMFIGSVEYRFPIVSKVQGALFTDFGAAWDSGWSPKHFHESIGLGLSVQTPVGPIRVDLAHGSKGNRVHFSVGGNF